MHKISKPDTGPNPTDAPTYWLNLFFPLTWLHMLWLTRSYAQAGIDTVSLTLNSLFHFSAWPFYSFLYASPVLMIGLLLRRRTATARTLALIASILCMLIVIADSMIYNLYAFHINGFVLNLVFTPGGISSLGSSSATYFSFALVVLRLVALQSAFLLFSLWASRAEMRFAPGVKHALLTALTLFLVQGCVYGVSDITYNGPVLDSSKVYPFFHRVRFRSLAKHLGFDREERDSFSAEVDTSRLNYPLADITYSTPETPPNIVILVAESLRWDQLSPEVMPNSWQFASRSQHFTRHYSSGNGTREALFGMFYGLYGSYWENFLHAGRAPLLMERIQDLGYRLDIRTSARFSYPEFDKTLFAGVPQDQLHEAEEDLPPWQRDEVNTTALIDFLGQHRGDAPFFSFFFLESTHAGYSFPDSSAIRKPYKEALDYANLSKETLLAEHDEMLNRYSNSAHWVDVQLGRIYQALEEKGLLDNTIVIVTGDHGEEFMENGAWGHNSSFTEYQTRVPMIVSMPGLKPAQIERLTSHMDIATTLMQELGAQNPVAEYSLGANLNSGGERDYLVISDWHSIAVLTPDLKYRIPYLNDGTDHWSPTDPLDKPLDDDVASALLKRNSSTIIRAMENCTLFSRRNTGNLADL